MNKKKPKVSIIIPSYESADTLPRAIHSVLIQDFEDFELIIVNNGSKDSTTDIVQNAEINDERVRGVYLPVNQRPAGGRNAGVQQAIGEFIAFLDADDQWLPGKLATQVQLLNDHPDYDLVFTDSWLTYQRKNNDILHSTGNRQIFEQLNFQPVPNRDNTFFISGPLTQLIYTKSFINMSTSLLRREKFIETGGFDEERFGTEDIDFWVRLSKNSKVIYWHHPTALCYQGEGTSKPGERWLRELIKYHRACLDSQEYDGLETIAEQNLLKAYRYLIIDLGLRKQRQKSIQVFRESLDLGFNFRLCFYTFLALLGPIPIKLGQRYTSVKGDLKKQSLNNFTLED